MAEAQRKAGVRDQVRQAVSAAQQAGACVVREPLLRALPGGLERQGWGGAGLVLRSERLGHMPAVQRLSFAQGWAGAVPSHART